MWCRLAGSLRKKRYFGSGVYCPGFFALTLASVFDYKLGWTWEEKPFSYSSFFIFFALISPLSLPLPLIFSLSRLPILLWTKNINIPYLPWISWSLFTCGMIVDCSVFVVSMPGIGSLRTVLEGICFPVCMASFWLPVSLESTNRKDLSPVVGDSRDTVCHIPGRCKAASQQCPSS